MYQSAYWATETDKNAVLCNNLFLKLICETYLNLVNGTLSSGRSRISHRGGMDIIGGCVLPRWVHFRKFVCQNERIWTCRGHIPSTPPNKSANAYIQSMSDSKFLIRMINLLGTSLRHSFITLICGLSRKKCISFFTCEYFTLMTLVLKKMLKSEIKKANWENRTLYFINMYVQIAMYFIKTCKICTFLNISKFTKWTSISHFSILCYLWKNHNSHL